MQLAQTRSTAPWAAFVIRPSVTLAIPYIGILGVWFLWLNLTVSLPAEASGPFHLISWSQFLGVTAGNLLLFVCLAGDGYRCLKSPPGMRGGHLLGIVLAIAALLVVQWGVVFAYGPIQMT